MRALKLGVLFFLFFSMTHTIADETDELIYPGNLLQFSLFGNDVISKDFRVNPQGFIRLPEVGKVNCNQQTLSSLEKIAQKKLSLLYKNANNLRIIKKESDIYVKVFGLVKTPGNYLVLPGSSIQVALDKAGGFVDGAQMNQLQLHRNGSTFIIDYKKYLDTGDNKLVPSLIAMDEIFVPSSKLLGNIKVTEQYVVRNQNGDAANLDQAVKVFGEVHRPGAYAYNKKLNALDYIMKAGGTGRFAATDQIKIIDNERAFVFNLSEYLNTAKKELIPNIALGSTIFVPQITEMVKKGSRTVYLMGQVHKPGAYELNKHTSFMDVLANAGGPNHYAEARKIRLIKPDGKVVYFDMQAFIDGRNSKLPDISAGDVIYIPIKTDLNEKSWLDIAPERAIKIIGAVNRPGRYEWSDEMSLMDILANAGGPSKGADIANIRIVSNEHARGGGTSVTSFNLNKYIENHRDASLLPQVKAGYTIIVPEPGVISTSDKSIKVFGEVRKPGVYSFNVKSTALDYLLKAEGTTRFAATDQIKIIDNNSAFVFNLKEYLNTANKRLIPHLVPGATLFVPRIIRTVSQGASTVYAMGQVNKPGSYELNKHTSFMDVLANAGGPNHYAEARKIRLIKPDGKVVYFDMQAFIDGRNSKLPGISAGDVIYIPIKTDLNEKSWLDIAPERAIKIIGAVNRPGRYEWSDEMSLMDILANAGGPSKGADIANIRIVSNEHASGGGTSVTSFNLNKYIENHRDASLLPQIKAGYTIIVPEPGVISTSEKSIKVFGEVRRPGVYSFNVKATALDYLLRAEGTTRFAATDKIKIIDNNSAFVFNLKEYLNTADKRFIPHLVPGATLFVPRIIKTVNEGASTVYVMGQVHKAGSYEINKNSTFMDVLANSGGPDQYAETAKIRIIRANGKVDYFSMPAFIDGRNRQLPTISAGDVIYVPTGDLNRRSWLKVAPNHAVKIIGAVKRPGRYEWSDEMTLMDIIGHAAGPTSKADIAHIRIITDDQGKAVSKEFNLQEFVMQGGDVSKVPKVKAGDLIDIPELPISPIDNKSRWTEQDAKNSIYVFGEVGKPGRYNFNDQLNFLDILSAADGPTAKADTHDIHVIDRQGVYPQVVHVNLSLYFETGDPELLPKVLPGDAIYLPKRNNDYTEVNTKHFVKVLGEVKRPGRYRYTNNMTVLDLLAASGGPTNKALVSKILVVNVANVGPKLETRATGFDLLQFSKTGDITMLPTIREGDVIYVPNNDEDIRTQFSNAVRDLAAAAIIIASIGGLKI